MLERLSWKALVWGLFLFCLPAFVLSLFIGHLPWLLVVSLLSALIWHAYNLMKLSKWLWLDRSVLPQKGKGLGAYFFMVYDKHSNVTVNAVEN